MEKIEKPKQELSKISGDSVMLFDGTACQIYKGEVDLFIYHINSDEWYRVTHITKYGKKTKQARHESKNPF